MYCPKCGTENPDGTSICRNCSCALTGISPTPATVLRQQDTGAKTSALAITSLVLALLSFCTFFLTAPLAVLLGIISLIMIARSHGRLKGTGMAVAGIAVPIVLLPLMGIFMAIMIPAFMKGMAQAQRVACSTNMTALGKAMHTYASDYNNIFPTPSNWCDLLIEHTETRKEQFLCPAFYGQGRCHYAINPQAEPNSPADVVLLFETNDGWNQSGLELLTIENHRGEGCNVVFVDGHVEFIRAEDIDKLRWTAEQ
ncbi:MAG: DUF4190 domain-containing protein [Sedimentisphaerales bacterium]|nr:DUF4190 domain-containing protein [Sedimentisphaerales bacterium]